MNIRFNWTDTGFLLMCSLAFSFLLLMLIHIILKHNRRLRNKLRRREEVIIDTSEPAVPVKDQVTTVFLLLVLTLLTGTLVYKAFGKYLI